MRNKLEYMLEKENSKFYKPKIGRVPKMLKKLADQHLMFKFYTKAGVVLIFRLFLLFVMILFFHDVYSYKMESIFIFLKNERKVV